MITIKYSDLSDSYVSAVWSPEREEWGLRSRGRPSKAADSVNVGPDGLWSESRRPSATDPAAYAILHYEPRGAEDPSRIYGLMTLRREPAELAFSLEKKARLQLGAAILTVSASPDHGRLADSWGWAASP